MFDEVRKNPWVRAGAALGVFLLVVFLLFLLRPVLISLFFAFLVAYLFDPVVDTFERMNISRSVTIACLAVVGVVLLFAIPLFFIPNLIYQADRLIEGAESGLQDSGGLSGWVRAGLEQLPLAAVAKAAGCATEEQMVSDADALPLLTACFSERIREAAVAFFQTHAGALAAAGATAGMSIGRFLAAVGGTILGGVIFLGNVALFAFVAGYLLKDYDRIVASTRELIPLPYREKTVSIARKIDLQIRGFVRGQLVVCMCLGLVYAIGFTIGGVPFGLLIALFGAIANFIPYLGLALTILPATILVIVQYGGVDWHLWVVLGTFVVAQLLEGTVLTPMIVGDKVGLGPVWVILAVIVFGNALGFLGLLLAVPIAAALKVLIVEALAYYRASPVFKGPSPQT